MLLTGLILCDPETGPASVREGDLRISEGRIEALGDLRPRPGESVVSGEGLCCFPGLVVGHVHLCQTLFRNLAEGLPLLDWLRTRIWPLEAAHDPESLRISADLGLAELLRGGVTAFQSMETVHGTAEVFAAAEASGLKALIGNALMDSEDPSIPKDLRMERKRALEESEALRRAWHGKHGGRLRHAYAPRFLLSCTRPLLEEVAERSSLEGARIHTHGAEHPLEGEEVRKQYGKGAIRALEELGLLGPGTSIAHCVHLEEGERELLADRGCTILHCPTANLKLGSGIAGIAASRRAGIPVALGPDGAPCNNRLDPWMEMRQALLAASLRDGPGSLSPWDLLRMATSEAADALGFEGAGRLRPGAPADLCLVEFRDPFLGPGGDPAEKMICAGGRDLVRHVLVEGRFLLRDGRPLRGEGDPALLRDRAERALARLLGRAGFAR